MVAAFAVWLNLVSFGAQLDSAVPPLALVVSAGFALWGCIGQGADGSQPFRGAADGLGVRKNGAENPRDSDEDFFLR